MKAVLPAVLTTLFLTACGAMPISEADRQDVRMGKKALLETNNRQLSDFLFIIPIFTDVMGGQPNQINIEAIDGEDVNVDWKRVNYSVALVPGKHVIKASCAVKLDDFNRDVNDRSDKDIQWSEGFVEYDFMGGKKYRIYAKEYINGTCTMHIKPK